MRDGLAWNKDYVEAGGSHVIEMLSGPGRTTWPPSPPTARWRRRRATSSDSSSGTSNLVSSLVAGQVAAGEAYEAFRQPAPVRAARDGVGPAPARRHGDVDRLLVPLRHSQDSAPFGNLYLRDGSWDGRRLRPRGGSTRPPGPIGGPGGQPVGAHWWIEGDDLGSFAAPG